MLFSFRNAMIMGLCPKPYKTLTVQNFALQSGYATASIFAVHCFDSNFD